MIDSRFQVLAEGPGDSIFAVVAGLAFLAFVMFWIGWGKAARP